MGSGASAMSDAFSDSQATKALIRRGGLISWAALIEAADTGNDSVDQRLKCEELCRATERLGVSVDLDSMQNIVQKWGGSVDGVPCIDKDGFLRWYDASERERSVLWHMSLGSSQWQSEVVAPETIGSAEVLMEILRRGSCLDKELRSWGEGRSRSVDSLFKEITVTKASQLVTYTRSSSSDTPRAESVLMRTLRLLVVIVRPSFASHERSDFPCSEPVLVENFVVCSNKNRVFTSDRPPMLHLSSEEGMNAPVTEADVRAALAHQMGGFFARDNAVYSVEIPQESEREVPAVLVTRGSSSYPGLPTRYIVHEAVVTADLPPWPTTFNPNPEVSDTAARMCAWDNMEAALSLFESAVLLTAGSDKSAFERHDGVTEKDGCQWCKKHGVDPMVCGILSDTTNLLEWDEAYLRLLAGGFSGSSVLAARGVNHRTEEEELMVLKIDDFSMLQKEKSRHQSVLDNFESLRSNVPGSLVLATASMREIDSMALTVVDEEDEEEGVEDGTEAGEDDADARPKMGRLESTGNLNRAMSVISLATLDDDWDVVYDSDVEIPEGEDDDGKPEIGVFAMELTGARAMMKGLGIEPKVATLADIVIHEQLVALGQPSEPLGVPATAVSVVGQVFRSYLRPATLSHPDDTVEDGLCTSNLLGKCLPKIARYIYGDTTKRTADRATIDKLEEEFGLVTKCREFEGRMQEFSEASEFQTRRGYAHGDLNGRNIIIDSECTPWLIDFATWGVHGVCIDLVKMESCMLFEYLTCEDDDTVEFIGRIIDEMYGVSGAEPKLMPDLSKLMAGAPRQVPPIVDIVLAIRDMADKYLSLFDSHDKLIIYYFECMRQYPKILSFRDTSDKQKSLVGRAISALAGSIPALFEGKGANSSQTETQNKAKATGDDVDKLRNSGIHTFPFYCRYQLAKHSHSSDVVSGKLLDTFEMFECTRVTLLNSDSPDDGESEGVYVWSDLLLNVMYDGQSNTADHNVLITGPSGSGKTVLLKQLMLYLLSHQPLSAPTSPSSPSLVVPFYFEAAAVAARVKRNRPVMDVLDRVIRKEFGKGSQFSHFWRWCREDPSVRVVLLLDSLARLPHREQRKVAGFLRDLSTEAMEDDNLNFAIVVTMRTHHADDLDDADETRHDSLARTTFRTLAGFRHARICQFSQDEIRFMSWMHLGDAAQDFLKELENRQNSENSADRAVASLCKLPYKLSLLVVLYSRERRFPTTPAEVILESIRLECKRFEISIKDPVSSQVFGAVYVPFMGWLARRCTWKWLDGRMVNVDAIEAASIERKLKIYADNTFESAEEAEKTRLSLTGIISHFGPSSVLPLLVKVGDSSYTYEDEEEFAFLVAYDICSELKLRLANGEAGAALQDWVEVTTRGKKVRKGKAVFHYQLRLFDVLMETTFCEHMIALLSESELKILVHAISAPRFGGARSSVRVVQLLVLEAYRLQVPRLAEDYSHVLENINAACAQDSTEVDEDFTWGAWVLLITAQRKKFGIVFDDEKVEDISAEKLALAAFTLWEMSVEGGRPLYELLRCCTKSPPAEGTPERGRYHEALVNLASDENAPESLLTRALEHVGGGKEGADSAGGRLAVAMIVATFRSNVIVRGSIRHLQNTLGTVMSWDKDEDATVAALKTIGRECRAWRKRCRESFYDAEVWNDVLELMEPIREYEK